MANASKSLIPAMLIALGSMVSQMAIPRVQPDTEIDVWVDPTDRESVVIDPKLTT